MKSEDALTLANRSDIDKALEVLRGGANSARAREDLTARSRETFDLPCVCAVHDRPYILRFTRQPNGRFRHSESVRVAETKSTGAGTTRAPIMLSLNEFDLESTPCAWCSGGDIYYCGADCGAYVCNGRMKGRTFHCRPSCGAEWVGVELKEVKGTARPAAHQSCSAPPRTQSGPLQSPSPAPAPAPAPQPATENRLLLGSGQSQERRRLK